MVLFHFVIYFLLMAHKKAGWSSKNLKDSNPKFRGVKKFGGQSVVSGNILIRQKGDKYVMGDNVIQWRDFTVHAVSDGTVVFSKKKVMRFDGKKFLRTCVSVKKDI
jgi:large subunit ribosomal protein L27